MLWMFIVEVLYYVTPALVGQVLESYYILLFHSWRCKPQCVVVVEARDSSTVALTSLQITYEVFHSRVRPRRVRPVRWQIKGCQTTEPRTFDSGFSGKVNLSTLSFMVHLRTYLLPSVYPITYYLGYPLYVQPSLTFTHFKCCGCARYESLPCCHCICWPSYLKSPRNMDISWGVNHSVL